MDLTARSLHPVGGLWTLLCASCLRCSRACTRGRPRCASSLFRRCHCSLSTL
ncbi:hypothetical protein OH77DRAFT_896463 [Trametes cingulata]|nr:hypothetical protein OH77DRAFT_896463 [Trametes cingulata]